MLIYFANPDTNLTLLHRGDDSGIAIATLHEFDQAVRHTWLYLPDDLTGLGLDKQSMTAHLQLHLVTNTELCQCRRGCQIDQFRNTCLTSLIDIKIGVQALTNSPYS